MAFVNQDYSIDAQTKFCTSEFLCVQVCIRMLVWHIFLGTVTMMPYEWSGQSTSAVKDVRDLRQQLEVAA